MTNEETSWEMVEGTLPFLLEKEITKLFLYHMDVRVVAVDHHLNQVAPSAE